MARKVGFEPTIQRFYLRLAEEPLDSASRFESPE
jgi:hypothetical protein